jgi:hypothetical protein
MKQNLLSAHTTRVGSVTTDRLAAPHTLHCRTTDIRISGTRATLSFPCVATLQLVVYVLVLLVVVYVLLVLLGLTFFVLEGQPTDPKDGEYTNKSHVTTYCAAEVHILVCYRKTVYTVGWLKLESTQPILAGFNLSREGCLSVAGIKAIRA